MRRMLNQLTQPQPHGAGYDIAQAMEYLINATWTTGAVIDVDGGMGLGAAKL